MLKKLSCGLLALSVAFSSAPALLEGVNSPIGAVDVFADAETHELTITGGVGGTATTLVDLATGSAFTDDVSTITVATDKITIATLTNPLADGSYAVVYDGKYIDSFTMDGGAVSDWTSVEVNTATSKYLIKYDMGEDSTSTAVEDATDMPSASLVADLTGKTLTSTAPELDGYTFAGWSVKTADDGTAEVIQAGSVTTNAWVADGTQAIGEPANDITDYEVTITATWVVNATNISGGITNSTTTSSSAGAALVPTTLNTETVSFALINEDGTAGTPVEVGTISSNGDSYTAKTLTTGLGAGTYAVTISSLADAYTVEDVTIAVDDLLADSSTISGIDIKIVDATVNPVQLTKPAGDIEVDPTLDADGTTVTAVTAEYTPDGGDDTTNGTLNYAITLGESYASADWKTDITEATVSTPANGSYYAHVKLVGDGTAYTDSDVLTSTAYVVGSTQGDTYTITFDVDGGTAVADATTGTDGILASLPTAPTKETTTVLSTDSDDIVVDTNATTGVTTTTTKTTITTYTFEGWYLEDTFTTKVTTSTVFEADTTVYAKWTEVETEGSHVTTSTAVTGTVVGDKVEVTIPDDVTVDVVEVTIPSTGIDTETKTVTVDLSNATVELKADETLTLEVKDVETAASVEFDATDLETIAGEGTLTVTVPTNDVIQLDSSLDDSSLKVEEVSVSWDIDSTAGLTGTVDLAVSVLGDASTTDTVASAVEDTVGANAYTNLDKIQGLISFSHSGSLVDETNSNAKGITVNIPIANTSFSTLSEGTVYLYQLTTAGEIDVTSKIDATVSNGVISATMKSCSDYVVSTSEIATVSSTVAVGDTSIIILAKETATPSGDPTSASGLTEVAYATSYTATSLIAAYDVYIVKVDTVTEEVASAWSYVKATATNITVATSGSNLTVTKAGATSTDTPLTVTIASEVVGTPITVVVTGAPQPFNVYTYGSFTIDNITSELDYCVTSIKDAQGNVLASTASEVSTYLTWTAPADFDITKNGTYVFTATAVGDYTIATPVTVSVTIEGADVNVYFNLGGLNTTQDYTVILDGKTYVISASGDNAMPVFLENVTAGAYTAGDLLVLSSDGTVYSYTGADFPVTDGAVLNLNDLDLTTDFAVLENTDALGSALDDAVTTGDLVGATVTIDTSVATPTVTVESSSLNITGTGSTDIENSAEDISSLKLELPLANFSDFLKIADDFVINTTSNVATTSGTDLTSDPVIAFEINVNNGNDLSFDLTVNLTVKGAVKTDLESVRTFKLIHGDTSGTTTTWDTVTNATYDKTTGVITFKTKDFSPFSGGCGYVSSSSGGYGSSSSSSSSSGSSSSGGSSSGSVSTGAGYSYSGNVSVNGTYINELRGVLVGEMVNLTRITTVNGQEVLGWYYDAAFTQPVSNPETFVFTSDAIANGIFAKTTGSASTTLPDGSTNAGAGGVTSGAVTGSTSGNSSYTPSTVPSTIAKILSKLF